MNKVLVFTVIYPQADIYINEFFECLKSQTFRDFDLLIVNDGCDDISLSLKFGEFNLKIIDSYLSPAKNRELGIRYAFENNYQKLIFCDPSDIEFEVSDEIPAGAPVNAHVLKAFVCGKEIDSLYLDLSFDEVFNKQFILGDALKKMREWSEENA